MQHICEMLNAIHTRIRHLEAGGGFVDLSEDQDEAPGGAAGGAPVSIDLVSDDEEQTPTLAEILEAVRQLQETHQITPQLSKDQLLLSYGDKQSASTITIQGGKIHQLFIDEITDEIDDRTFANTKDLMHTVRLRAVAHSDKCGCRWSVCSQTATRLRWRGAGRRPPWSGETTRQPPRTRRGSRGWRGGRQQKKKNCSEGK